MEGWEFLLVVPALVVALLVGATAAVAYQAAQRGYSFVLWFIVSLVILNPVIFLVLLALMPNRKRKQLRAQFHAELAMKLRTSRDAPRLRLLPGGLVAGGGSTAPVERSLGDLPTMAPRERSLGDEETRG